MNNITNLFDLFGGRKAGMAGGVIAALLTFVGTGTIDGPDKTWAIIGVIALSAVYSITNVWHKEVTLKNGDNGEVKQ